jgi:hypothetical protein
VRRSPEAQQAEEIHAPTDGAVYTRLEEYHKVSHGCPVPFNYAGQNPMLGSLVAKQRTDFHMRAMGQERMDLTKLHSRDCTVCEERSGAIKLPPWEQQISKANPRWNLNGSDEAICFLIENTYYRLFSKYDFYAI